MTECEGEGKEEEEGEEKEKVTSKTGTPKAASSFSRVAAAKELLQLLMNLKGGGLFLGKSLSALANRTCTETFSEICNRQAILYIFIVS